MGEAKRRKQLDPDFGNPPIRLKIFEVGSIEYETAMTQARERLGGTAFQNLTGVLFYLFSATDNSGSSFLGYAHPTVNNRKIYVDLLLLLENKDSKKQVQPWWRKVEAIAAEKIAERVKADIDDAEIVLVKEGNP
ncbi:hypothetical protein NIES2135_27220 [Leptolyngbya boryana NIES-2135]|jgi:hypothetical protein|uniref:Uncharacterized protein n=1 Tax=Leptolyngbya boryana NIES-2135 TaxID=1973484 RepID=A0A1Z4JH96_LEPBY|nr:MULTISPECIES: hypothetical protein [Leptolyngbya]BAY55897.1 hypothetical protein NIES2135_27220 [Leptolyngbya boryana NIES-2135]MBD2368801.1 hypothetical protein [Leptolyngbya sp. FACHB-161]MBD2375331.1 hypothetical protein [Leptolyngbya sp. FACHB-238]MBD2399749.1 hypothetical protein [Leptolyngbya sp. FACHB-239]MBD2405955.1 hypothetical protein [Leptolyngbya sp. FACHB-402]